ncbi:MAG TPA: hypothetical protein VK395_06500 [Gemmataceae bacterium]|nr:hypothetical protein [Gemmataceae bacterium]
MPRVMHEFSHRWVVAAVLAWLWWSLTPAQGSQWPEKVEAALVEAHANRPELEKVLEHYRQRSDKQKFAASCFLISNMPGHAFVTTALFDGKGNALPFDVLSYKGLGEAQRALTELEKKHGTAKFDRLKVASDLETVTADYLIDNIDLAFKAWRAKPWAKNMSFDTFCECILPYRANREPVERWRAACEIDTKTILAEMKNPSDPREAASLVQKHTKFHVGFSDLYYLHPTDQGFHEMCNKPVGRCGDISNMDVYIYRANCIAVAGDYTPYWANRDNNHGWDVILDKDGRGNAGLFNRAAKVYRKTFAHNPEALFYQRAKDEKLPQWLAGRSFRDVTDQYMQTTDVTVSLEFPPPKPARFAYICVFNGGEWKPIHWGWIHDGRVTFTKMGRNIAYLVGYYVDDKIAPAAPPFILDEQGKSSRLVCDLKHVQELQIKQVNPSIKDDDLKKILPGKDLEQGKKYQLYVWNRGWQSLAKMAGGMKDLARFEKLPAGGLYWVASEDDRETARIFTIEGGKQRFW